MTLTGSNLAGTPHRAYGAVLKETDLTREGGYIAWDVDTNNPETELQAFSHPFASLWLRNTDAGSIDWAIEESSDRQDWSTVTSGSLAGSTADTVADVELSEPYVRVELSEDGHDAVTWFTPTPQNNRPQIRSASLLTQANPTSTGAEEPVTLTNPETGETLTDGSDRLDVSGFGSLTVRVDPGGSGADFRARAYSSTWGSGDDIIDEDSVTSEGIIGVEGRDVTGVREIKIFEDGTNGEDQEIAAYLEV